MISCTCRKFAMPTQSRCIPTPQTSKPITLIKIYECKNIEDTLNILVLNSRRSLLFLNCGIFFIKTG